MALEKINTTDVQNDETNVNWIANGERANEAVLNRPAKDVAEVVNRNIDDLNATFGNIYNKSEADSRFVNVDGDTVNGDLIITGDLTVNGTTTSVNSTVTTLNDPIITLADNSLSTNDGKDRGIEFKYGDGSNVKTGFFGWDNNVNRFKFIADGTNSDEVISGAVGDIEANNFIGKLNGVDSSDYLRRDINETITNTLFFESGAVGQITHKNPTDLSSVIEIGFENDYLRYRFGGNDTNQGIRLDTYDTPVVLLNRTTDSEFRRGLSIGTGDTTNNRLNMRTNGTSSIVFQETASNTDIFDITYDGTASSPGNKLFVRRAGNEIMTFTQGDRVGIGSDSPSGKLEVNVGNTVGALFTRNAGDNGTDAAALGIQTTTTTTRLGNSGDLEFRVGPVGTATNNQAETMRLNTAGNLGVGTSSPASRLHVRAPGLASTVRIESTTDSGGQVRFKNTLGEYSMGINGATNGEFLLFDNTASRTAASYSNAGGWDMRTAGLERLTIDPVGNVGIGTGSPTTALDVSAGRAGNFIAYFNNTDTGSSSNGLLVNVSNSSSTNTVQRWRVNGTEVARINAAGEMGIGTANPQYVFHAVEKNAALGNAGVMRLEKFNSGDNHLLDIEIDNSENIVRYRSTGTQNGDHRFCNATQDLVTIKPNGDTGFGTTSPIANIDVANGSSGRSTLSGNYDDMHIQSSGNTGITISSPNSSNCGIAFADASSDFRGGIVYLHNQDEMRLYTSGAERLTINAGGTVQTAGSLDVGSNINMKSTVSKIEFNGFFNNIAQDSQGNMGFTSAGNTTVSADSNKNSTSQYLDLNAGNNSLRVLSSGSSSSSTNLTYNGNQVWHAANDGPGSGLNADLVDGLHGSQFLRSDFDNLILNGRKILDFPSNSVERGPWNPIISSIRTSGRRVYSDEEFSTGTNNITVYNNSGGDGVQIFREDASTTLGQAAPNKTQKVLRISNNGNATSPGSGGFFLPIIAEDNKTFVQIFQAKLPAGYSLVNAENSQGTGATIYWLTSQAGTGKWEWYARVAHCGYDGSFSSGGHVYVSRGSQSAVFDWYLASANVYDVTDASFDADRLGGISSEGFFRISAPGTQTVGPRGQGVKRFESNDVLDTSSQNQASLEVYNPNPGADAFMTFHIRNDFQKYFGLHGGINDFVVGGGSSGNQYQRVYHDGYRPFADNADLLDGAHGNTSGTDISGNKYVRRHAHGYIFSNYFNMTANQTSALPSRVAVETGSDKYLRWQTLSDFGSNLPNVNADRLDGLQASQFLRSDTSDTMSGRLTVNGLSSTAGANIVSTSSNPLRIQRSSLSQTGQDDNVSIYTDDGTIYFTHNNDDDGDSSQYTFRYTSGGSAVNLLDFNAATIRWRGHTIWHANNDGPGSGMHADLLDGYNATASSAVNTIAVRDGSGDIHCRLIRSTFGNQSTPPDGAAIAFRNNNSSDNYVRFTDRVGLMNYIERGNRFATKSTTKSDSLGDSAWIASYANANNRDHIWHDEGSNTWHFVSDSPFKSAGNSAIKVNRVNCGDIVIASATPQIFFQKAGFNDYGGIRFAAEAESGGTNNNGGMEFWTSDDFNEPFVWNAYDTGSGGSGAHREWMRLDNTGLSVYGNVTAYDTSDERLKDNMEIIPNALDKVMTLNGYSFNWNDKQKHHEAGMFDYGLSAQEVQEVLPAAVKEREGYLTVNYQKVIPLLVASNKELKSENDELKSEVQSMKEMLLKLAQEVQELKNSK